jgi:hypothetical protein
MNTPNYNSYILNETNMLSYLVPSFEIINSKQSQPSREDDNDAKKIINAVDTKIQNINTEINTEIKNDTNDTIFFPKEQDTLFWCYYIILNGEFAYETLHVKNSLIAKQLKIDYITKIRENKPIVKTYKCDSITNIESNLANDNNINIKTVVTLCAIDNINIVYVSNKTFFELLMNDTDVIYLIREKNIKGGKYNKTYGFEIIDIKMLEMIRNTLYKLDVLDKPVKALSAYKVADLTDIANKLAIELVNKETGKKRTKNELYESIVQYF